MHKNMNSMEQNCQSSAIETIFEGHKLTWIVRRLSENDSDSTPNRDKSYGHMSRIAEESCGHMFRHVHGQKARGVCPGV